MYVYKTIINDPSNVEWNGKFYIGAKTSSPGDSENYYGSGTLLKEYISQHGTSKLTKVILEEVDDANILVEREYVHILDNRSTDMLNIKIQRIPTSIVKSSNVGIAVGIANAKRIVSCETREKIGAASRNRSESTKIKMSRSQKGRVASEETRKKLSESRRKENLSEETRRRRSESAKNRRYETTACPHCGLTKKLWFSNTKAKHFDNCTMRVL